jgi:cyclophilin family peptidyl-prolyl cis-trans isomerase
VLALAFALAVLPAAAPQAPAPVAVVETVKGVFEIQFFPGDAPKSVAHLVGLLEKRFYRGQRITRVTASLVQFGDPQSRDMTKRANWGSGGSGTRIGAAEFSKRTHARGIVALAHPGNAAAADSQLFILKAAVPSYDGQYTVVGRVTAGMAVVDRLAVADLIKQASIKAAAQPF